MSIEITMPRLSDTMEQGTVIKWNKNEGDSVSAGDVIADVETDKATMEMPVYDDGTIARILVQEGQTVDVGALIAVLAEENEDPKKVASEFSGSAPAKATQQPAEELPEADRREKPVAAPPRETHQQTPAPPAPPAPQESPPPASQHGETGHAAPEHGDGRVRITPVARRMAEEHHIDVRSLQGSGPAGRIIKRDVQNAVETGVETVASAAPSARELTRQEPQQGVAPTPVPATTPLAHAAGSFGLQDQQIALSGMRQTIARRLVESKTTIPHYQVTVTFNMDALLDLRRELNESLVGQGVKLSVNDFLVRACALAMYEHPYFNASWAGESIRVHGRVNIGIAVSLPVERGGGLIVATIFDADRKTLREISYESKMLADKARTRGLSQQEMSESTFTLSNLGMFGVDNFTAIINPPNSAILAVGAAIQKPVVRQGEVVAGYEMAGTLSCDHRVIDGAMAAQYLQTLRTYLEAPATLLV